MTDAPLDIYVSRQPIFKKDKTLWGYRTLFTQCGERGCSRMDPRRSPEPSIVADSFALATRNIAPDKKICICMDLHAMVADNISHALPAKSLVLDIPAKDDPETAIKACALYRKRQHALMLNNYQPDMPEAEALARQADYVSVSFAHHSPQELMAARQALRGGGQTLLADNLEDWEAFEGAKALGFKLFQGPFFAKPEQLKRRKLTSGQSSRMRLLSILNNEDAEIDELSSTIATDAALSIRLLRFVNSPALGLRNKVGAIPHAASLLGLKPLKSWSMAAVLADMDSSDKGSALCFTAMVRAVFLKLMAEQGYSKEIDPETMFLLGLLSNIDALLSLPMEEALAELSLADCITDAFLHGKGRGALWIDLLARLESGDLEGLQESMERLGIPPGKTAARYMQATAMSGMIPED